MVITYVIEHLEAELFPWSILEYNHVTKFLSNRFIVSNLPFAALDSSLSFKNDHRSIENWSEIPRSRICLLDEKATKPLSPTDASSFDIILAGGILGDVGENDLDRTSELRSLNFPSRHLGNVQMTMDTAILTASKILDESIDFESLSFVDSPSFSTSPNETIEIPFRFLQDPITKEPIIAPGMKEFLTSESSFF